MRVLFLLVFPVLLLIGCGEPTATAVSTTKPAAGTAALPAGAVPTVMKSPIDAAALANRELESPDIRVTVGGVDPAGALLIGQFAERQYRAAEGVAEGNSIVFRQEEPFKPGHYYAYFKDGAAIQLLIDQDQTFSLELASASTPITEMKVSGSVDNELLYRTLAFEAGQQDELKTIGQAIRGLRPGMPGYEELQADRAALVAAKHKFQDALFAEHPTSLYTSFKRAGRNPQLKTVRRADGTIDEEAQVQAFLDEFWSEVDFNDERLLNTPVIANKLERYIKELTPQNAQAIIANSDKLVGMSLPYPEYFKFFANWITRQYEPGKTTVMDGAAIHVHMIQNYFTKERAFWADSMTVYGLQDRADQMAHSLVGQKGVNVKVPGPDGQPKALYDLKKPYLVVFMYNPTCDHCIEETPKLVNAYNGGLNKEVDVYAIALDTEDEQWRAFVEQNGMQPFTNVHDPTNRSIFKTYYVDNTPELYLLGPDRTIVAKNLKVEQLPEAIRLAKERAASK